MTEFQVGDRVSVEGVVTHAFASVIEFKPNQSETGGWTFPTDCVTLIERPKRKLRVGSVWEVKGGLVARYVVSYFAANGEEVFISLFSGDEHTRSDLTFDSGPHLWREVPVEELEREAQA